LNGALTDELSLSASYTYLDSEVIKAAPGAVTGAALANAPEHSFSAWVNYRITNRLDIGAGARYVSEQLAQNTGGGKLVPSYHLLDVMGRYRVSDTVTVKLNVTNLTDEYYFEQLHPWHVVPGPGVAATFALNVAF
jgi:catecholate siderophore receptor